MHISDQNWEHILKFWGSASHVSASPNIPYCVFATVDEDGSPRVAPYTSLILGQNKQGYFFDEFSPQLTKNLDRNKRISVLLIKNEKWFWMKTVLFGKFDHAPGIRLMGSVGEKRKATAQEIRAFKQPLRKLKFFKGYQPLWEVMTHVRDIHFESFEPVRCGAMKYVKQI
jgi:hypothetical protein